MKAIPAGDLQTNLDVVLDSSQGERIVILRKGRPSAVLVGIEHYDREDLQWATSPEFWQMIRQRREDGRSVPLAEVESRLGTSRRKAADKRRPNPQTEAPS